MKRSRRDFLTLGSLTLGAFGLSGCTGSEQNKPEQGQSQTTDDSDTAKAPVRPPYGIDIEKWKRGKGIPYQIGDQQMPGVCLLPGPQAKRNWPDKDKYKDTEKIPGMCQLCSTICGIIGYVKDDRVIKIEGNPNDPNSRGKLCARGQASLNHLYHPERLLYPLKRVGERGEGK